MEIMRIGTPALSYAMTLYSGAADIYYAFSNYWLHATIDQTKLGAAHATIIFVYNNITNE